MLQKRLITLRLTGGLAIGALVFSVLLSLLPPATVSAMSSVGPDPADMGSPGEIVGYVITSADNAAITVPKLTVPVYWRDNIGTKNVVITDGNQCTDPTDSAHSGTGGNDSDIDKTPLTNGATAAHYYVENVTTNAKSTGVLSRISDSNSCYQATQTLTFNAATYLTYDTALNLYYANFTAESSPGLSRSENRFRIRVDPSAIVGYSSRTASTSFAISHNFPRNQLRDIEIPFAPDCSIAGPTNVTVELYDLDNASPVTQGGYDMKTYVEEIDAGGVTTRIPLTFTRAPSRTSPAISSSGGPNGYIVNSNVNKEYVYVQMSVRPGYRYKLGTADVYNKNVLQFQLPFDSIYFNGVICPPTPPPPPPPPPPPVQPYMRATGGDVVTGASFSTNTVPCGTAPHVTSAGIVSWNRNNSPNFAGAGGQYAVRAMGQIQDFVTGQGNGRVLPGTETTELSFANVSGSSVNTSNGLFGGLFNDAPCVDYWGSKPDDSDMTLFTGGGIGGLDGNYYHNGNLTLSANTIPDGRHLTLYVKGSVSITDSIKYANTSWPDRKSIPSLRIIANGVVYINNNVTQLDGMYVAVPNTGATTINNTFSAPIAGTISTCANGFSSYNPNDYGTSHIETTCAAGLTVNGSLIGHQLWFLRGGGSLATSVPAETINYPAELWLAPGSGASIGTDYQSIIGLPPQL